MIALVGTPMVEANLISTKQRIKYYKPKISYRLHYLHPVTLTKMEGSTSTICTISTNSACIKE